MILLRLSEPLFKITTKNRYTKFALHSRFKSKKYLGCGYASAQQMILNPVDIVFLWSSRCAGILSVSANSSIASVHYSYKCKIAPKQFSRFQRLQWLVTFLRPPRKTYTIRTNLVCEFRQYQRFCFYPIRASISKHYDELVSSIRHP